MAHFVPGGSPGEGRSLAATYSRFGERVGLALSGNGESLAHVWRFNDLGRLYEAVLPGGADPTLGLTYRGNGDLDTITHGNGLTSTYTYQPHGPLESITVNDAGSDLFRLFYAVDAAWNVTAITESVNGTPLIPDYVYAYDGFGRLDEVTSYPSGLGLPTGSPAEDFGYDAASNRDDDDQVATPWSYDANVL